MDSERFEATGEPLLFPEPLSSAQEEVLVRHQMSDGERYLLGQIRDLRRAVDALTMKPKARLRVLAPARDRLRDARALVNGAVASFVEAWHLGEPIPAGFIQEGETIRQLLPGEASPQASWTSPAPGLLQKVPSEARGRIDDMVTIAEGRGHAPREMAQREAWRAWYGDSLALAWFYGKESR